MLGSALSSWWAGFRNKPCLRDWTQRRAARAQPGVSREQFHCRETRAPPQEMLQPWILSSDSDPGPAPDLPRVSHPAAQAVFGSGQLAAGLSTLGLPSRPPRPSGLSGEPWGVCQAGNLQPAQALQIQKEMMPLRWVVLPRPWVRAWGGRRYPTSHMSRHWAGVYLARS